MRFEWDDAKSERPFENRGIDFTYASTVFLDANRIEAEARTVNGENRFSIVGKATGGVLLFVVCTWRNYEGKKVCRIISAR